MNLATLGIDFGVLNALNLWVAALLPAKDGQAQLWDFVFHEDRPDLGEIKLVSRTPALLVPASADHLVLPWDNYDRMESLWLWRAWVEGTNLCALAQTSEPVVRIPLDAPPSTLVRPALAVESGEFDVPFITAGGRELVLARFRPGRDGQSASGSIAWRAPLAAKPVLAQAALGPKEGGSLRRVALVRQDKEGVAIELLDLAPGRQPPGSSSIRIPKFYAVPAVEPGVRIDDHGATHVALLLASNPELTDLSIVDISFAAGRDTPPSPKIEKACDLSAPPVAGGITFQSRPDRPMRRDWVVLQADGSLLHSQSGDKAMRLQGKPVRPLQLVALSQSTYILTLRVDGPFLEALR